MIRSTHSIHSIICYPVISSSRLVLQNLCNYLIYHIYRFFVLMERDVEGCVSFRPTLHKLRNTVIFHITFFLAHTARFQCKNKKKSLFVPLGLCDRSGLRLLYCTHSSYAYIICHFQVSAFQDTIADFFLPKTVYM